MMLTIKWHGRGQGFAAFLSSAIPNSNTRFLLFTTTTTNINQCNFFFIIIMLNLLKLLSLLIFVHIVIKFFSFFFFRKKSKLIKLNISTPSESNVKKANLSASRKERIKLPNYEFDDGCGGKTFHISEFLGHPSGIQAMLNTNALQSFQPLDTNTYRSLIFSFTRCVCFT